jgi:hypothetical protein
MWKMITEAFCSLPNKNKFGEEIKFRVLPLIDYLQRLIARILAQIWAFIYIIFTEQPLHCGWRAEEAIPGEDQRRRPFNFYTLPQCVPDKIGQKKTRIEEILYEKKDQNKARKKFGQ